MAWDEGMPRGVFLLKAVLHLCDSRIELDDIIRSWHKR